MKARELIEALQQIDPETEVIVSDCEGDWRCAELGEKDRPLEGAVTIHCGDYFPP